MSYDIELFDKSSGETIEFPEKHHLTGGTYALGGTKKAELNVTYNYSAHFRRVFQERPARISPSTGEMEHFHPDDGKVRGIRVIYGMTGAESIPVLTAAAEKLTGERDDNYWLPTEGNAKAALLDLITLAAMCPEGVWRGD